MYAHRALPVGAPAPVPLRSTPTFVERLNAPRESLLLLDVTRITPNPDAPRQQFSQAALDSLAESIKCWGQLQPILVRHVPGGHQLICGERRWRAHLRAGLPTIWAIERQAADSESLVLALVENLQREGLSHAEKVSALDQLLELSREEGLRHTARQLRITPGWLSSQLAVRRDPVIFSAIEAGSIGFGQAAELIRAPVKARPSLLQRTLNQPGRVTTATIRAWVAEARAPLRADRRQTTALLPESISKAAATPRPSHVPSRYCALLEQLRQLDAPRSADDVAAVHSIVTAARRLLAAVHDTADRTTAARKTESTEVRCLMCGDCVGAIERGRTFEPRDARAVRLVGRRLTCGRCGGSLAPGERTERYRY